MSENNVREHISRCIELYGNPIDDADRKKTVPAPVYEQARADLLLAIGMLMALEQSR